MRRVIVAGLALVLPIFYGASVRAETNGSESALELLATAKITGACGILDSLIYFQKTTKLNGGDDFVTRFWSFEAARMGKSVEELSTACNQAVTVYDTYWKAFDTPNP